MKNNLIKRGMPLLLVFLLAFAGPLQTVFAATLSNQNIEVTIAVGSSDLDVSSFAYDVQTAVYEVYGIPKDRIKITRAGSTVVDSKNSFNWNIYDHYYHPDYPTNCDQPEKWSVDQTVYHSVYNQPYFYYQEDDPQDESKYFTDVSSADDSLNYCNNRSKHIYPKDNDIVFLGYSVPAYKDFMLYPDQNTGDKTIQFSIDDSKIDKHTLEGAGFLFNTSIIENKINGYLILYEYPYSGKNKITLYRLNNVDADTFHDEESYGISDLEIPGITWVATKDSLSGDTTETTESTETTTNEVKNIKVQLSKNSLKFYEDGQVIYDTTGADSNITIEDTGAGGFGPLVSYANHYCSDLSYFTFKNLTMQTTRTLSFQEVIEQQTWTENTKRFIVYVDDDGVPEFANQESLSPILAYMRNNGVDYIGWGRNKKVTSEVYNKDQVGQFLAQNNIRGLFINSDDHNYDTYNKGIAAIAEYIYSRLVVTPEYRGSGSSDSITVVPPKSMFIDMKDHWAEKEVEKLGALKLLQGYADGTFRPDNQITRAEFATILAKVYDLAGTKDIVNQPAYFSDIARGDWYYDAVSRLAPQGIILGYGDGTFGPNKLISREEAGAMIARLASKLNIQLELADLTFEDNDQISNWAKNPLGKIISQGIITGMPDGKFYPANNSTRAEAAVMILRLVEKAKLL
ncbi:MAG: S-layer homology domain-containing protein [Carboxydocellales bacterium]